MRILIVDDHVVVRDGLRLLLEKAFAGAHFGECRDGDEALKTMQGAPWDIAILDISMPGRSGLEVLQEILARWPKQRVLMLSSHSEKQYAARTLKMGAAGFLNKDVAREELIEAVRKIGDGGLYVTSALGEQLASQLTSETATALPEDFSEREYCVLRRLVGGHTVAEIAQDMALSRQAVNTYRHRILQKLRLETVAQLVTYAKEHDLAS